MKEEQQSRLPVESLAEADGLIRQCFLQLSEGNGSASFPDEVCGNTMTKFLEIMKHLEVQLTNLHSNFLQDEQKRISKVTTRHFGHAKKLTFF